MTLYLYKFNNYYNRISKYYATLDEYAANGTLLGTFTGVNFISNDGVSTSQILNYGGVESPDYLIVADEDNNIVSRWFVIDTIRTRLLQYSLSLYRDLIADYRQEVLNAPMFIEKATLPLGNPLLFNKENISFNQIKTSEHLLKDSSECAWIVGYVDKNFSGTISVLPIDTIVDYDYTSFDQYPYNIYADEEYKVEKKSVLRFNWWVGGAMYPSRDSYCYAWNKFGNSIAPLNSSPITGEYFADYVYKKPSGTKGIGWKSLVDENDITTVANRDVKPLIQSRSWIKFNAPDYVNGIHSSTDYEQFEKENGKIMRVGGKTYRIKVYSSSSGNSVMQEIPQSSVLGLKMGEIADALKNLGYIDSNQTPTESAYEYECSYFGYKITYEPVYLEQFTANITGNRLRSQHLPYDIFCIPYGDIRIGETNNIANADYAIRFANEIIRNAGAKLYDIQLLPYCPVIDRVVGSSATNDLRILVSTENNDFILQAEDGTAVSVGIWVNNPDFSLTIPYVIERPMDAVSAKISNECDLYRIVSPNYNGEFEFSPAKNEGVSGFIVDCSYKPFTPYIRVSPNFDGLYGGNFGDARGLICGGDFSLTQASDSWVQYQIQNKNFQVMFDRQIQSMDINNNVQREQERWARITGAVGGAAAGAATGSMIGGAMGKAGTGIVGGLGAAIGAGVSWAAGTRDMELQEQLRQEARDMTIDQFGYQLQNIAARPASLTKVSSLNKNNKLFPFIEYFTSTDVEKQAFRNKLLYNGMTVMAIGTMNDYIQTTPSYIKGKLVRLEGISDDYHLVNSISEELNKGVYI